MVQQARRSVKVFPALARATGAPNLDVFQWEFVIVRQLFSAQDPPQGEDYDVLLAKYVHNSRVAVRLEIVKKKSGKVHKRKCFLSVRED